MIKSILSLAIIGLLTFCTSQKEVMNSWVGSTKQNLIMSWGPPLRTTDDGAGGEILVYAKQVYIPSRTSTFHDGYGGTSTTTSQPINYWDYKMFWVNTEGKIYHWITQKHQIPPTQIDLNVYRRN
jgi:hypothetical protein